MEEAIVELEKSREEDRPIVSDVLTEMQASSSIVPESQAMDSDLDSDCSDSIADGLSETNSQENTAERLANPRYYTVEQLNDFLNATKNQRKPEVEMFFSDLKLFIKSSLVAMKKATLEDLD